ncbi:MAG: hypothetical protein WCP21_16480, partial [Armatimonadota bacterium]
MSLTQGKFGPEAPMVSDLHYSATDASGPVFKTTSATLVGDRLTFALEGPGAGDAELSAQITPVPKGCLLDWHLRTTGPQRQWQAGSGFHFDFAQPVTDARTHPIVGWVSPTGREKYEVPGDTPYPVTEWQWREADFGANALVMLSPVYDPDWLYGHNLERAPKWGFLPPAESPGEATLRMGLFVGPTGQLRPATLAAEAAGRRLGLAMSTGHVGNLFEPGETATLTCSVSNATDRAQSGVLSVEARDYNDRPAGALFLPIELPPLASKQGVLPLKLEGNGIVFVAARLSWANGETVQRTTLGFLPKRPASAPRPESPFGLAGMIASPEAYPDQYDLPTLLDHAQRIGARWVRGGWFPLQQEIGDAEEARVRERMKLLADHGIMAHCQLGATVLKPEELPAFQQRLKASLQRFSWVTPYVEVGNELNGSATGPQYVEGLLKPVHEAMRAAHPTGKILSMGLGGVGQEWLNAFVKAGGMELVDTLSIHPGSQPRAPEFWEGWRGWVFRSQVQDALKAAAGKPVWITEAYAPTAPDRSQTDLRASADYLVRTYVCALALGVKVVEWYQFQDGVWFAQRPLPSDTEYNYGIVYTDLTPKPAYLAYGAMTEQLEGAVYQGRLELGAPDLYGVRFLKGGQPIDVLWSYREKHETDLPWWPVEKYAKDARQPGEPWRARWKAPVAVTLP